MKKKEKKTRLNLCITTEARRGLEALMEKLKADTITEAIRRTLAIADIVVDHDVAGGDVILRWPGGDKPDEKLVLF